MEDEQKSAAERLVSLADTLTISLNTFVTKNLDAISNMGSTFISFVDETLHLLKKSKDDYEERLKQGSKWRSFPLLRRKRNRS